MSDASPRSTTDDKSASPTQTATTTPTPTLPSPPGPRPNGAFFRGPDGTYSLYHELHGSGPHRLIMIMGFAATCRLFDRTANYLASTGEFTVLTYDHRGAGLSHSMPDVRQTSSMLASDALQLLEHLGWCHDGEGGVHVYGASMGGMVAQELAVMLLSRNLLSSLYLAVTCLQRYAVRLPFPPGFWNATLCPIVTSMSRERLAEEMLKSSYSQAYLEQIDAETQQPRRVKLYQEVLDTWDVNMSWNSATIAAQSCVVGTHSLSDASIERLNQSNVPIKVQIATEDQAMPTELQRKLAARLRCSVIEFPGGHLECDMERFHAELRGHCLAASAGATTAGSSDLMTPPSTTTTHSASS